MKNLVCTNCKLLFVSVVFLLFGNSMVYAGAFITAKLTVDGVSPAELNNNEVRGYGKVYVTASATFDGRSITANTNNNNEIFDTKITPSLTSSSQSKSTSAYTIYYSNVKLKAETFDGSYFSGWIIEETPNSNIEASIYENSIEFKSDNYRTETVSKTHSGNYYVKFLSKTYHAKWPEVGVVVFGKDGQPISSNVGNNSVTVTLGVPGDVTTGTLGGDRTAKTYTYGNAGGTTTFTQTADDNGKTGHASYTLTYSVSADEANDFFFVGWTTDANGSGASTSIVPNGGTLTTTDVLIPTTDANYKSTPTAATKYYAVFQQKYTSHFYATSPTVAIAGNSSISEATISSSQTGTIDVNNSLSCPVTYTAHSTAEATFIGWSTTQNGSNIIEGSRPTDFTTNEHTFTRTYTASFDNVDENGDPVFTIPTLYAVYESFYCTPTLKFANEANGLGEIAITTSSSVPANDSDAWKTADIQNGTPIQIATKGGASATITLYYHAKENTNNNGYFVRFSSDAEGTISLSENNPYEKTGLVVSSTNPSQPTNLTDIYAVFKQRTIYLYAGATAYVAGEMEGGTIKVTYEDGTSIGYTTSIQDGNIYEKENVNTYTIRYEAQVSDSTKYAFRGWSMSPNEGLGSLYDTPLDYRYEMDIANTTQPHTSDAWYAIFASYYYKNPPASVADNSIGGGLVHVSNSATPSTNAADWQEHVSAGELVQLPAKGNSQPYDVYFHAKTTEGSEFVGWSTTADGKNRVSSDNPYMKACATMAKNKNVPAIEAPLYAVFKHDFDIRQQDRMIVYEEENGEKSINDAKVLIDFQKGDKLSAALSGADAALFTLSNRSGSKKGSSITFDATQGLIELVVSYQGDLNTAVGKKAEITLSATYGDYTDPVTRPVTIVVEEAPVITFLPTDGMSAYTVKMTNGSGINYIVNTTTRENTKVAITHESMSNLEMHHLVDSVKNSNYYFFGWQMIDGENTTYLSNDDLCNYQFTKSVKVRAEFIPKNKATFIVYGEETPYHDLQLALDRAAERYNQLNALQSVVFANEFKKTEAESKSGILYKRADGASYTIPEGVTLVIPDSADYKGEHYTPRITDLQDEAYFKYSPKLIKYRKLIVEDGTNIIVKNGGKICVSAKLTNNGAIPMHYGYMELGANTHIQLETGAELFAWGYITNPIGTNITEDNITSVGRISVGNGATVYEPFAFRDWRGGNATADFVHLSGLAAMGAAVMGINTNGWRYQVFPISQYYVQNVEVPLTFERGAKERVSLEIEAGGSRTPVSTMFIDENEGFMRLKSDDASITKYYDPLNDRLKFILKGSSATSSFAQLGTVSLSLGQLPIVGNLECVSSDYILPINNNIDITIQSIKANMPYNMAMMAGSTFTIKKDAHVVNNAQLYVYDTDENTFADATGDGVIDGYLGANNDPLVPIKDDQRPDSLKYKRYTAQKFTNNLSKQISRNMPVDLQDATLVIDGVFENQSGGYLLTTKGGARIISNGGGKVIINTAGIPSTGSGGSLVRNQTPYQFLQANESGTQGITANKFVAVPMDGYLPKLQHGDGTHASSAANTTYTYYNDRWNTGDASAPTTTPVVVNYTPKFSVDDTYTFDDVYVGTSKDITLNPTTQNDNINWGDVKWTYNLVGQDAQQFTYSGNAGVGQITFTPTSEGTKYATFIVTATYEHTKNNQKIAYTYIKSINLIGNATYLHANTLAFADLDQLYNSTAQHALFQVGSMNNTQGITITLDPANLIQLVGTPTDGKYGSDVKLIARAKGTVTITATQKPDYTNNIAGTTITKTIEVHDRVLWNWDILYFGTVNENPVTVLGGSIDDWTLEETSDPKNIIAYDPKTKIATIEDQIAGKYTGITFTFKQNGEEIPFESHVIANPQHLRVDVNNDTVFRAVTLSANEQVVFYPDLNDPDDEDNYIEFVSTDNAISQWKLTFIGVPDKLHFIPEATNTWQIEESSNGTNWTTSFPWKNIPSNTDFEMSLLPSTRYLRISYGAGNANATTKKNSGKLREFYITKLMDVKSDVEKLYIPASADIIPVTKEVVFTYANTGVLGITTSNTELFKVRATDDTNPATETMTIPATNEDNPFGIKGIEVISTATTSQPIAYLYVNEGSRRVMEIPIITYDFPQELPIKLATDKPDGGDRFYYVTTHTHNVEWDGTDGIRTITLQNAVSDADPYLTFAFEGAPTYISFNHTPNVKGIWEIEEFVPNQANDGYEWKLVIHDTQNADVLDNENGTLKRSVSNNAKEIRVIYKSDYAEKLEVTNLVIVGDASAIVDPARMELDYNVPDTLTVSAINLPNLTITSTNPNFTIQHGASAYATSQIITSADSLGANKMTEIPVLVKWLGSDAVEFGTLLLTTTVEGVTKELATVELIGIKGTITDGALNIFTGVPAGYDLNGEEWEGKEHREVNIRAAFSTTGKPLFDYVVVYGETTTSDGTTNITRPNTMSGSNAKTPCYIYQKNSEGTAYQFLKRVENTNVKEKAWDMGTSDPDAVTIPDGKTSVSMYINGFCPYASTGYTKADEGVWYFRANGGQSVDIYLDSCYIYSRAKTDDGHFFIDRQDGYSFVEPYVCGSGAVLVFACNDQANTTPMNVTIHTLNHNMLKSHYGCFLQSIAGRAFQASSPVQIRVINDQYVRATRTTLNFTDEWPASQHPKTGNGIRTNGFLSLQKQVNNAPSIDMGAPNTIVNFNGGQVELQNAQIVSTNYVSSMAICHRAGTFAGILLAYGMGTDAVEGTVNFNDGTTTVLPMYVSPNFAESYLLDKNAQGNYITNSKGEYLTTCLRTPANTFVTGGSHCMMRACTDPTTSGGAPRNLPATDANSKLLGLYKYPKLQKGESVNFGWIDNGTNGLVKPSKLPTGYTAVSVTPNNNATPDYADDDYLNFWFDPEFESSVTPEVEKPISFWKTCMTKIEAEYAGYGGSAGGEATVLMDGPTQTEIIKNLMYCKIDNNILEVIRGENYQAPVKNPAPEGGNYLPVHPSSVQQATENYITNQYPYQVEEKIYYITTATADVWNAFTAPFDVANIYIMETYPEKFLQDMEGDVLEDGTVVGRFQILKEQAKHNADFAAFFAVTVALGQQKTFETIYQEYITWANLQDASLGLTTQSGYTHRGMQALVPFDGFNWATADFYLNENNGNWTYTGTEGKEFNTSWITPDASDSILLHKGRTYSMLLPFCTKCGDDIATRTFWDYWSGKFLIFESTAGPHTVDGSAAMADVVSSADNLDLEVNGAQLSGNRTFSQLSTKHANIYNYVGNLQHSTFKTSDVTTTVRPTESFLLANIPTRNGMRPRGVTTSGEIIYDTNSDDNGNQTPTGNIPTVGGGNNLYITSIAGGINIAVAAPQYVRVISSTGALLFQGKVQTSVDIALPTAGVYVIAGETEAHKILY